MTIDLSGNNGDAPEDHDPETGEVLDHDAPDTGGWDRERHCITSLQGAEWAARKYREAVEQMDANRAAHDAEVAEIQRVCDEKMARATARLTAADRPFSRSEAFFHNALDCYAQAHREEVLKGLRGKSRLLQAGVRIGWSSTKGGYRLNHSKTPAENKAALLAWAQKEEDVTGETLAQPNPTPDVDAIKRHLAALDAEEARDAGATPAPPGLEYVPPGETLSIDVEEK